MTGHHLASNLMFFSAGVGLSYSAPSLVKAWREQRKFEVGLAATNLTVILAGTIMSLVYP